MFFLQVVLSLPTQQNLNANQSLVTYLQPLGSLGVPNMEQGQVIIGASDMQGNLTLHNVAGLTAAGKRGSLSECFVLKLLFWSWNYVIWLFSICWDDWTLKIQCLKLRHKGFFLKVTGSCV